MMKAEINRDGVLVVRAVTELEAYALRMWANQNFKKESLQAVDIEVSWHPETTKVNKDQQ